MSAPAIERAVDHLDVDGFWERGYAILPGVYTPEEIEAFRQAAYASRGYGGDLLANPRLRSVITDGRMAAVARKLLGTDELFYSGDSSFTINGTQKGWHKDNADRIDPEAPDWVDRYTQLRFGIYCQDHSEHTGGLNLRIGSHDMRTTTDGECLYVKTKPGDLAVWSMRITHSGNGMLLKDPDAPFPMPNEHDRFKPEEVAEADGDRIALFAHIGADDKHAKRYARLHEDPQVPRRRLAQASLRRRGPRGGQGRCRAPPARHAGRGHGRPERPGSTRLGSRSPTRARRRPPPRRLRRPPRRRPPSRPRRHRHQGRAEGHAPARGASRQDRRQGWRQGRPGRMARRRLRRMLSV